MSIKEEIEAQLVAHGVATAATPRWRRRLSELTREGALVRLFPGVYVLASMANDLHVRCAAVMAWDPDAVITGAAAARLTFWPKARVRDIEFSSVRKKRSYPGFRLRRDVVAPEHVLVSSQLRVARGAWVAVDRAAHDNGACIDEYLRATFGQVAHITSVARVFVRRNGNRQRRLIVGDSRSNPWSQAERLLHQTLRDQRIGRWVANLEVRIDGHTYFLDTAFADCRVVIEVEGADVHARPEVHERDCRRHSALVAAGWQVLRVSWSMLQDPTELAALVRRTLRRYRRSGRRHLTVTASTVENVA